MTQVRSAARIASLSARPAVAIAALGVELAPAGTAAAPAAPSEFRILPAGSFKSWDGRPTECAAWVCTEADGRAIAAELSGRASPRVIDYEHATLLAKQSGQPAPAGGWFKAAEWRVDGLWLTGVSWTATAARQIAEQAYRFVSPVFSYDPQTGRVQQLLHAALTNDPGLDGLTDLAAALSALATRAADVFSTHAPQEKSMNELLKKLLAALGLQDTVTETEALAAVAALKSNVAALSAQVATPDPARFVPVATLSALQGEHASLQGRFAALQGEVDGARIGQVVADGLAAGKLTPATEAWARDLGKKDLAQLSAFIAAAPVVAKPGGTQSGGSGGGGGGGGNTVALSAEQKKVCEMLGVPEADFLKNLPAAA